MRLFVLAGIGLSLQKQLDAYKRINKSLELYLTQLKSIDLESFQQETEFYNHSLQYMDHVQTEDQLNILLRKSMIDLGIDLPWQGNFDTFMSNKKNHLVFR